ncbi:hypothetical protein HMPREF1705_04670 [Acetomicrobium hydrogeniformans ATCC BAA-1850]|uniref:Uncharacterized protein n=1 Tax=Acetomicrobium hydrogeniformans ATCC BAA-1850 TaxID=592015 RepID=A0A0T5XB22_9BACT|nr:hypothetical protein HMPREF1705_04670 [Acetomicrobium hydrogeniformans ATCC BAA-1850]
MPKPATERLNDERDERKAFFPLKGEGFLIKLHQRRPISWKKI